MEEITYNSGTVADVADVRNGDAQLETLINYRIENAVLRARLEFAEKDKESSAKIANLEAKLEAVTREKADLEEFNAASMKTFYRETLALEERIKTSQQKMNRLEGTTEKEIPGYVPKVIKPEVDAGEFSANPNHSFKNPGDIREVYDLHRRLKESEINNSILKERFRKASHMRAQDIAQRFRTSNNTLGEQEDGWSDASGEFDDTKQSLKLQLKEIDCFRLDDVLDKDNAVHITSKKESIKAISADNGNMATEHADFGSVTAQEDDEYPEHPSQLLKLPCIAPTVLKVNSDVRNVRIGSEYTITPSREPGKRTGLYTGPIQGKMVWQYGIKYRPANKHSNCLRTVHFANLPESIKYSELLAKVRGGAIVSAIICDSFVCVRTRSNPEGKYHKSALVVFFSEKSAKMYVQAVRKNPIFFDCPKDGPKRASIKLLEEPTYPTSDESIGRIYQYSITRVMFIQVDGLCSINDFKAVIPFGIEKAWADDEGNLHFYFTSMIAVQMAFNAIRVHPVYKLYPLTYLPDPCGRSLSGLLGVNNADEIALNYDDVDNEAAKAHAPKTVQELKRDEETFSNNDGDDEREDSVDSQNSRDLVNGDTVCDNASSHYDTHSGYSGSSNDGRSSSDGEKSHGSSNSQDAGDSNESLLAKWTAAKNPNQTLDRTPDQTLVEITNSPNTLLAENFTAVTSLSDVLAPRTTSNDDVSSEHPDRSSTRLESNFLVCAIPDSVVLRKKKCQGLVTSKWADILAESSVVKPKTSASKTTSPSPVKTAPGANPDTLSDTPKPPTPTVPPLSIFAYANTPTGPRALQCPHLRHLGPRRPTTTTTSSSNSSSISRTSRYASLTHPKAERSLRNFFKGVDDEAAATVVVAAVTRSRQGGSEADKDGWGEVGQKEQETGGERE